MQRRIVVALACVVACACDDTSSPEQEPGAQLEDGDVIIVTDATTYQPTESIVVTSTNLSEHTIYDYHCGGEVQGYEFLNRWNASYGMARGCMDTTGGWLAHSVAIPSNSTHVDVFRVNSRAYTGTWRVRLHLLNDKGRPLPEELSISNTFQVQGTWSP